MSSKVSIKLQPDIIKTSQLLKVVSNVNRLVILYALEEGENSVTDINALVQLSQSSLSQHLAILRKSKLVKTRRSAQTIYYSIADKRVSKILVMLAKFNKNKE